MCHFCWRLKQSAKNPPTAVEKQRLKASRRVALARVTSQKQKEVLLKQQIEQKKEEDRHRREAETVAKMSTFRAAAVARAASVSSETRQRERELELIRQAETSVKRERVAAVLAYDETKADKRENIMRKETCRRIQREERRRKLEQQQHEDERMEKMMLYEGKNRLATSPVPPAVQSARSFFSISGSTVREETA